MSDQQQVSAAHGIEYVPPEALTVKSIASNHHAFEQAFDSNGGYKGYEEQCIGILLERIAALEQYEAWAAPQLIDHANDLNKIAELERELANIRQAFSQAGYVGHDLMAGVRNLRALLDAAMKRASTKGSQP